MAYQLNNELNRYVNYESILLMHKILTGRATTRECRTDRSAMRFKSYVDGFIGTPIIETLVFAAKQFDKSILDTKTFKKKFELIKEEEEGRSRIYFHDGKIYSTEEITNNELKTAKSIANKRHPLIQEVKELLEYTTPLELTYNDYAFLDKLDFKISSVANLLSALGFEFYNKAPLYNQIEHVIGAYSDGHIQIYFKDGKTSSYNSMESYCTAVINGDFYCG